ncbi:TLC ATP/ADP transporter [Aureococcus anophagefferens]|nr:TLC ATP/ADP transporter [Aureococcus anophagefferens]
MAVKKSSGEPEELKATAWQGMELESATSPTAPRAADSYFEEVFTRLYGKMSFEEKLRLIWLSSTLFFIIGGYWLLRSLKDPVIATICGVEYIPKAKMLSVLVVTVLVFVYNKLIDMFPKHQLFYIVGGFYATLFTIIAVALALPATSSLSIYNTEPSPYRLLGWVSYCSIESFGSIGVSLFWAFTNSTYNLEGAKKAYGLMVACAQLGSIAGPTIVTAGTIRYGVPTIYFCGALCMVFMVVSIWGYNARFGAPESEKAEAEAAASGGKKKAKAGMTEGLVLFWKYHYVKGIFALSCLFMVEVTILDYSMKVLAKGKFDGEHPGDPTAATQAFATFMGVFGQAANGLSFVFAAPRMVFLAMLLLKGFSYCLNNPCKEILYQPTSSSVKFKAKSWIDVFGARGSKALGSVVTNQFADSAADLLTYGSFVAMGVSSFLIYVAYWQGAQFDALIESGVKVGEEPVYAPPEGDDDTSCGMDDDKGGDGAGDKKTVIAV